MRLNIIDKTIADPTWKSSIISKDKVLEDIISRKRFALTNDRLHRAKIDKKLLTLDTKVDIMFTPLLDTL